MQNTKSRVAAVSQHSRSDSLKDLSASKNESSSKSSLVAPDGSAPGSGCKPSSPSLQMPLPTIVLVDEANNMDMVGEIVHITFTVCNYIGKFLIYFSCGQKNYAIGIKLIRSSHFSGHG